MPKITIVKADWGKTIVGAYKPKYFTMGKHEIHAEIDVDKKSYEMFGKASKGVNDDMDTKVSAAGRKVYQKFISTCVDHVKWADNLIKKAETAYAKTGNAGAYSAARANAELGLRTMIGKEVKGLEKDISSASMAAFKKWQSAKKDYRNYKIKTGAKIGFAATTLVVRAVNVAAMPMNPIAIVLALRGTLRDMVTIVQTLGKAMQSVDSFQRATAAQFKMVKAGYEKHSKASAQARDLGAAFLQYWTSSDGETTLRSVEANIGQYRSKLLKVEIEAQTVGKTLTDVLNKTKGLGSDAPDYVKKEIIASQKLVDSLINELTALNTKIGKGEDWADKVSAELNAVKKAKTFKVVGKLVKVFDTVTDAFGGYMSWSGPADNVRKLASKISTQGATVGKVGLRWEKEVKGLIAG